MVPEKSTLGNVYPGKWLLGKSLIVIKNNTNNDILESQACTQYCLNTLINSLAAELNHVILLPLLSLRAHAHQILKLHALIIHQNVHQKLPTSTPQQVDYTHSTKLQLFTENYAYDDKQYLLIAQKYHKTKYKC